MSWRKKIFKEKVIWNLKFLKIYLKSISSCICHLCKIIITRLWWWCALQKCDNTTDFLLEGSIRFLFTSFDVADVTALHWNSSLLQWCAQVNHHSLVEFFPGSKNNLWEFLLIHFLWVIFDYSTFVKKKSLNDVGSVLWPIMVQDLGQAWKT